MSSSSPMNTPEIIQAITPLVDAFDRCNIPYFIGGSVASSIHGRRRATQDVDIIAAIQRYHVQTLVNMLENDGRTHRKPLGFEPKWSGGVAQSLALACCTPLPTWCRIEHIFK